MRISERVKSALLNDRLSYARINNIMHECFSICHKHNITKGEFISYLLDTYNITSYFYYPNK